MNARRPLPHKASLIAIAALLATSCGSEGGGGSGDGSGVVVTPSPSPSPPPPTPSPTGHVGAVYAGTNNSGPDGNFVVGFARRADGRLVAIDRFSTDGIGRGPPASPRLNPLISQDSILAIDDRYLLVVNAGSNDITSFRINPDFTLTRILKIPSGGFSPVSIAYANGTVYVANADEDGVFNGPPDQSGSVTAFRIDLGSGQLSRLAGSSLSLGVRPSDLSVAPGGGFLIVSGLNAGSASLASRSLAELSSYAIQPDGNLAATASGTAISTLPGNAAGRNLPNAIGIQSVSLEGRQYVIVAEARTATPAGQPGTFAQLQTGSVSSWELRGDGSFAPRTLDFQLGPSLTSGPLQAGWIACSPSFPNFNDGDLFCPVATAAGGTINGIGISATDGSIISYQWASVQGVAADPTSATPLALADGFVDLAVTRNFEFIYQLVGLKGRIDVYSTSGPFDFLIRPFQQVSSNLLPNDNLQGLAVVNARP